MRKENLKFKLIKEIETNSFYDYSRSNNGGGYHQPAFEFEIVDGDDVYRGYLHDTSCGDFGSRWYCSIKLADDIIYEANYDTVGNDCIYTDFNFNELGQDIAKLIKKNIGYAVIDDILNEEKYRDELEEDDNNYYDYRENIVFLGGSDISQLLIRTPNEVNILQMGSDGDYKGYLVFDRDLIPNYYAKKLEYFKPYWFEIIDDDEIVFDSNYEFNESNIDKLEVYRAGDFGVVLYIEFM